MHIEGAPPELADTFVEGIVEEGSEDESDEQKLLRARKGKMIFEDPTLHPTDHQRLPRLLETLQKVGPADDRVEILVDENDATKVLFIGVRLDDQMRRKMVDFLRNNLDVFAWSHANMTRINLNVMCHRLNIDPRNRGIRQKRRPISGERAEALKAEVDRLQKVGLVKEAYYPEWLANPVLVKKANGQWRVCIDFTDLNKACSKDSFPLPRIDQLVDVTAGHALPSFMDAYSGYN